jgi:hypothetical protein
MRFKGLKIDDFASIIKGKSVKEIEADNIDFIISIKERHYSLASLKMYLGALSHFYSIDDITRNRKKLSRFLSNDDAIIEDKFYNDNNTGSGNNSNNESDQPYTREQIPKPLEYADPRTRAMRLIMASAALRLGALPILKVADLTPSTKTQCLSNKSIC